MEITLFLMEPEVVFSDPPGLIVYSSNDSGPSIFQAPVGSFHNPIVVEEDDSDNKTMTPADNTRCPR